MDGSFPCVVRIRRTAPGHRARPYDCELGERGVGWVTSTPELVTAVRSAKQLLLS
ncbi:hypothetical protein AB0M32_04930 [Streptomyces sp. NPDC051985]|uniref:hypothetical protein n=1 Tax=Streptomyces sp. NPDC051985 TaxID=3155807 RepID=UPI003418993B